MVNHSDSERFLSHFGLEKKETPRTMSNGGETSAPASIDINGNDFNSFVRRVCQIFTEVTGAPADATREASHIMHFKRLGWEVFDFRMYFEFEFGSPERKAFYTQPGRMNIRSFLNTKNEGIILDIHSDLKVRDLVNQRAKEAIVPTRERKLLMHCGARIHRKDYDLHMSQCFSVRGACFFPPLK